MSVTGSRSLIRRIAGLTPLIIVASLFAAPAVMWLVKRDAPVIEETRTRGRVIALVPAAGQEPASVTVATEDGTQVRVPAPVSGLRTGSEVMVIRRTTPDGPDELSLEPL